MVKHTHAKQERVIEVVRRQLEGDAAVEFIRQCGYAMTSAGISRHLRRMGGRGAIMKLIDEGKSNVEILESAFPEEDFGELHDHPPSQSELFESDAGAPIEVLDRLKSTMFETRKLAIRIPADLYEAIRLAARAEGKSQNELIVEILTIALSRMPGRFPGDAESAGR